MRTVRAYLITVITLLGLLIGSFLNVVIARVPDGRSIVRPPSACPRCGSTLAWYDNVPLVSWVVLRGRCRSCRTPISARYPLVEAATSLLFLLAALTVGLHAELPAVLLFVASGIALSAIDIEHMRLPTPIVYVTLALVAVALAIAAFATHRPSALVTVVAGALAAAAFLFAIAFVSPRAMGMGDVRLAAVLGAVLGWYGMGRVALGILLGFVVGSIAGIALSIVRRRLRGVKMPFGPSLIVGTFIALAWGRPVIDWYTQQFRR
jgi:leader peptidase (prepilin peptidase) / N-methyltransferase